MGAAAQRICGRGSSVSGEGDGTPGWVLPSLGILAVAGVLLVVVRSRRLPEDRDDA